MSTLSNHKFQELSQKWSEPDSRKGWDWTFDGVPETPEHWMGYNFELSLGLKQFKCSNFDQLVKKLTRVLKQKPNVLDLFGGAYFLDFPTQTQTLTGVRIHDKDEEYLQGFDRRDSYSTRVQNIILAPNRNVLEADLLTQAGWNKVFKEAPRADLLVCRPVGLFDVRHCMASVHDKAEEYEDLYIWLFNQAIKLLNKDSLFFTEIPDIFSDEKVIKFFSQKDQELKTKTKVFEVDSPDYRWADYQRRFAVIRSGSLKNF